jgi:phosphomannomutase/phosphoglucomutase
MRRLFALLAAATLLLMLIMGFGVYWLSNAEIARAKQESAATEAKDVALGLSMQIALLNKTLDKMAQDPEVLTAVTMGNPGLLDAAATKLEKYIPDILKVRLLLPDISEPDVQAHPNMGFADLDMVRETLNKNQFPGIQGDQGPDRHLAIARGITREGKVIGVILASLDADMILKSLRLATVKDAYLELKQGTLVLGTVGQKTASAETTEAKRLNVANTDWAMHYRYADHTDWGNLGLVSSIIIVPSLLMLLLFFTGHRWLSTVLTQDMESLMKAFKDIMNNSMHGNYPVELTELTAAISNLMQFKRVLDYGGKESLPTGRDEINIVVSDDEDFNLDSFFDDSSDFKL